VIARNFDPETNAVSGGFQSGPTSRVAAKIHPERHPAAGLQETIQVVCQCSNFYKTFIITMASGILRRIKILWIN
jgi:hypothetical protein